MRCDGRAEGVHLVALMFEQVGHDLFEVRCPVAEFHVAGGRHGVELLIG